MKEKIASISLILFNCHHYHRIIFCTFKFVGVLHSGYDNRETIHEEYEVLCEGRPCSLKYLVAKKIRDRLKNVQMIHKRKYSTKVKNAISNIERLVAPILHKVNITMYNKL